MILSEEYGKVYRTLGEWDRRKPIKTKNTQPNQTPKHSTKPPIKTNQPLHTGAGDKKKSCEGDRMLSLVIDRNMGKKRIKAVKPVK